MPVSAVVAVVVKGVVMVMAMAVVMMVVVANLTTCHAGVAVVRERAALYDGDVVSVDWYGY